MTGITDIGGSSTLQSLTYGYYPTNNVQTITNAVASSQNAGSANMSYGYGTGNDQLGTLSVGGTVVQTIGYTADGRIASLNPGIQAPAGQYITSLSYNQDGRLTSVNAGADTLASYIYDGFEQRLIKTVSGSYGEIYQYGQDGALLEETNASGVAQADYIYLNGRPVAVLNGSTLYYLHDDRLGTPQVATESNQAVAWQASYDAFGQASVSGTVTQNLRLPGQYFDVESGWNHNGFRDYAPALGRYIEPDPVGRLGSGNNLYAYVDDNPTNVVDPLGLCPKKNCPTVPQFPKGANIDANIRATEAVYAADPTGLGAELWWADQVNSQSVWDYKLQDPDQSKYDDFGNFNYGATGDVFGFSLDTLEDGAVYARLMRNPSDQLENYGLKNPARKNEMIRQGMLYRQNGCGNF